jgi:hypothetical protein
MHKITLVCSAHRQNALCNAEELLRILRAIEPETIFEELRPSEFDLYYKHGGVEAALLRLAALSSLTGMAPHSLESVCIAEPPLRDLALSPRSRSIRGAAVCATARLPACDRKAVAEAAGTY